MKYKYTDVNLIEDPLGHRVKIVSRTEISYSFLGREILIGSEVLSGSSGIALYPNYHKLELPGSGGDYLTEIDVSEAVNEISRALSDVGTKVEVV